VPITVRSGRHRLIVEGLVKNKALAVVTTNASDVTDYANYLPIYHNETDVQFEMKYVSMFVVLDYPTYIVPSSGMLNYASYQMLTSCFFLQCIAAVSIESGRNSNVVKN